MTSKTTIFKSLVTPAASIMTRTHMNASGRVCVAQKRFQSLTRTDTFRAQQSTASQLENLRMALLHVLVHSHSLSCSTGQDLSLFARVQIF